MPSTPTLVITDGTTRVTLHSSNGLYLRDWGPARPADKKTRREPVYGGGGQVVINDQGNVIDTFEIGIRGHCQDYIITTLQDADRLLQKAVGYWASNWAWEPVWLEAKGPDETGIRYATIKDYSVAGMANPYAQPFFSAFGPGGMNELTIAIEHDAWQADEPGSATCVELYHSDSVSSPLEESATPFASAYDAYTDDGGGGSIDTGGADLLMGADAAGDQLATGVMFFDVDVPVGATIINAYIQFQCSVAGAGATCNLRIYGDTDTTPALFTTYADFWARVRTTTYMDWLAVPAWVLATDYRTPNFANVVQEIIGLAGWASGNSMTLFMQDHPTSPSTASAFRTAAAQDHATAPAPILHITYKTSSRDVGVTEAQATCEDVPYISNYHCCAYHTQAQGVSHVYYYDTSGASFSTNRVTAALPHNLFPAVPIQTGDILYIGAVDAVVAPGVLADQNVFDNVVFNIGTAATYGAGDSSAWQYWNGAAWVALTYWDGTGASGSNTTALSATGTNSVHWTLPSNWAVTVVNGVSGYWVRCYLTVATAVTIPTQETRVVYSCRWACVDIDEGQVPGDIPALAQWKIRGRSDLSTSDHTSAQQTQIIMGLRTSERGTWALNRGPIFQAYLPFASDVKARGQGQTYYSPAGLTATEVLDYRSPYGGQACQYVGGGAVHAALRFCMIDLNYPTAGDFVGAYHMFVRYRRNAGATNDLKLGYRLGPSSTGTLIKSVYLQQTGNIEVADFGRVVLQSDVYGRDAEEAIYVYLHFYMECTVAAARNCWLYDVVLIPADEWYCKAIVDSESGDILDVYRYLDVDSATTPKDRRRCVVRDVTATTGYYKTRYPWTRQGAGPAILQANVTQTMWFFSFQSTTLGPPPSGRFIGTFPLSASLRCNATARYLSMRGSR